MLKIEEGKYYRARNGEKIGPMKKREAVGDAYCWRTDNGRIWDADGFYLHSVAPDPLNLIAEWTDSPSVDLTAITTPFGLLDEATQKALREHSGPIERYDRFGDWVQCATPGFERGNTYRVRPQPPKPREYWINIYESSNLGCHKSRESADSAAMNDRIECIHVREVL